MARKNNDWQNTLNQVVFSTSSDTPDTSNKEDDYEELPKANQRIRIYLDRKKRRGKSVTLISGLDCSGEEMKKLATNIKKLCGVGGSIKDYEILIQGDHRDKVLIYLKKEGYPDTKLAGG